MIKIYKKAAAAVVAIALLLTSSTISMGQFQTPTHVRVGLFYKDASVNTALSIFNVSAASGLQAGYFSNNNFTEIYRESSSATLYTRKDAWFYQAGDALKEYNPSTASADVLSASAKWGPYHMKIGSDCPDQATAASQVTAYRQAGVKAYIAYNDSWQVWVGAYVGEAAVQADIAVITPVLGEVGYAVIPPAANRIVLVDAQYQPLCIFGSTTAYFQLRPAPENNPLVLSIKGKAYRGALEVRRLAASDMTVINYVSMQEYLYGNVPAEIGGRSPAEAIKAQALASKMYAINNMGKHSKTGFDLCPTTSCQVYKGFSSEVASCNAAIDEVKDLVITYDGKLAGAIFYFASSGGRTEDVSNVWGSSYPYLVSVEDKYEKIYTWTKTLRTSDIKAKLPQLGNILGVSIAQTAESGRVTQLAVRGDNRSDPAIYLLEKCRTLFSLDSQLYTITTDADVYTSSFSHIPALTALVSAAPSTPAASGNRTPAETVSLAAISAKNASEEADRALARMISQNLSADSSQTMLADSSLLTGNTSSSAGAVGTVVGLSTTDSAIGTFQPASAATDSMIASSNQTSAANQTPTAITTQSSMIISIPLPVVAAPVKTQLGGMKVATVNGLSSLSTSNNKITILGAGGAVKTATLIPETYTFTGKGWGHAVGLSQEGAIGMGKAGIPFDQILTHYFQGTKIEQG
jgi:stage II sporulation protein D